MWRSDSIWTSWRLVSSRQRRTRMGSRFCRFWWSNIQVGEILKSWTNDQKWNSRRFESCLRLWFGSFQQMPTRFVFKSTGKYWLCSDLSFECRWTRDSQSSPWQSEPLLHWSYGRTWTFNGYQFNKNSTKFWKQSWNPHVSQCQWIHEKEI